VSKQTPNQSLDLFGNYLCPSVVREITAWESHPELSKVFRALQSQKNPQQFLDHYAEALLARHFIKIGLQVKGIEVANPKGKRADLQIISDGIPIYIHLKRLNTDSRTQASLDASVNPPFGFIKDRVRMIRLLKAAYEQFIPNALNVITMTSPWDGDVEDFEEALLGQGSRRPGFWNEGNTDSAYAVWFRFDLIRYTVRFQLFFRDTVDMQQKQFLERLFPDNSDHRVS